MPREIGKTKRKESNTMRRQRLCGFIHFLYPKFQTKKTTDRIEQSLFSFFRFMKRSACDAEFFLISKTTVGCNRQREWLRNLLTESNKRVDMSI